MAMPAKTRADRYLTLFVCVCMYIFDCARGHSRPGLAAPSPLSERTRPHYGPRAAGGSCAHVFLRMRATAAGRRRSDMTGVPSHSPARASSDAFWCLRTTSCRRLSERALRLISAPPNVNVATWSVLAKTSDCAIGTHRNFYNLFFFIFYILYIIIVYEL